MNRYFVNVLGNFGSSFLSPLVGGNAANYIFNTDVDFGKILAISALSALFITTLSISKEASEWKKKK
jgi:hypothetical protein